MSGSCISSGFAETIRTHGTPASGTDGWPVTLSETTTSGRTSSQIAINRSCAYFAPATSSTQNGLVTVSSCTIVGFANSGAIA